LKQIDQHNTVSVTIECAIVHQVKFALFW